MTANRYNLKMGAEDPKYLDAENSWEMNYWSYKLKCSKEELLVAVNEVGPKLENIQQFITMINAVKNKVGKDKGKDDKNDHLE